MRTRWEEGILLAFLTCAFGALLYALLMMAEWR